MLTHVQVIRTLDDVSLQKYYEHLRSFAGVWKKLYEMFHHPQLEGDSLHKLELADAALGRVDLVANLRKLDKLGVAFKTRKCELAVTSSGAIWLRYKQLSGAMSKPIDVTTALICVPSACSKAEGRGFDITGMNGMTHTFMACSTAASVNFKNKVLRANVSASASGATRASLKRRALLRLDSVKAGTGVMQTGRGFMVRGKIEIQKMSSVVKGARSSFLSKLSGREWNERYFTLSHDGVAGVFMNEAEFETHSAMAEAVKREGEEREGGGGGKGARRGGGSSRDIDIAGVASMTLHEEYDDSDDDSPPPLALSASVTDPIKGIGTVRIPTGVAAGETFAFWSGAGSQRTVQRAVAPPGAVAGMTVEVRLPPEPLEVPEAAAQRISALADMKRVESWHVHQNKAKAFAQSFDMKYGVTALERVDGSPRQLVLRGPRFRPHGKMIVRFATRDDLNVWVGQVSEQALATARAARTHTLNGVPHISTAHPRTLHKYHPRKKLTPNRPFTDILTHPLHSQT